MMCTPSIPINQDSAKERSDGENNDEGVAASMTAPCLNILNKDHWEASQFDKEGHHQEQITPVHPNPGASDTTPFAPSETFTLFAKLPTEIRLMIWRLTFPLPRDVDLEMLVHAYRGSLNDGYDDIEDFPMLPVALFVSSESRAETMKHFIIFISIFDEYFYTSCIPKVPCMNLYEDTGIIPANSVQELYFSIPRPSSVAELKLKNGTSMVSLRKLEVTDIGFSDEDFNVCLGRVDLELLTCFSNLQELTLTESNYDVSPESASMLDASWTYSTRQSLEEYVVDIFTDIKNEDSMCKSPEVSIRRYGEEADWELLSADKYGERWRAFWQREKPEPGKKGPGRFGYRLPATETQNAEEVGPAPTDTESSTSTS